MGRPKKAKLDQAIREKYESLAQQAGLTSEEVRAQMLTETPAIPVEEIDAFLSEFFGPAAGQGEPNVNTPVGDKPADDGTETPVPHTSDTDAQKPADKVAKKYDYSDLTGKKWEEYQAAVAQLELRKMVDFAQFRVEPIMEERYPGLPDTPRDMVGIRITSDKPLHVTRITPEHAMEFNKQIRNTNKYYLLAQ